MRHVIDLSTLNTFVENSHFQMENLSSIKSRLRSGNLMTKLDLQDAYLTVAIDPLLQKFRRFIWKEKVYQSQALPFGLNMAPLVFTKLLKLVAAFLRKQGIRLVLYLRLQVSGNSAVHSSTFSLHWASKRSPQREVNNNSNSGNHFPRLHRQLEFNDANFTTRKSKENSYTLPTNTYGRRCYLR